MALDACQRWQATENLGSISVPPWPPRGDIPRPPQAIEIQFIVSGSRSPIISYQEEEEEEGGGEEEQKPDKKPEPKGKKE